MNLSAVTKSMNKHLEEWRTEMEWRERDPTWGLSIVVWYPFYGDMSRRKESACKCAGNELHLITNVSYSMIMSEARSSPTQHTCNQSQVLWLWKSTVNPTNHSQSKLWITRKTTLSNRILNLALLGHFCLFPMLNSAFRALQPTRDWALGCSFWFFQGLKFSACQSQGFKCQHVSHSRIMVDSEIWFQLQPNFKYQTIMSNLVTTWDLWKHTRCAVSHDQHMVAPNKSNLRLCKCLGFTRRRICVFNANCRVSWGSDPGQGERYAYRQQWKKRFSLPLFATFHQKLVQVCELHQNSSTLCITISNMDENTHPNMLFWWELWRTHHIHGVGCIVEHTRNCLLNKRQENELSFWGSHTVRGCRLDIFELPALLSKLTVSSVDLGSPTSMFWRHAQDELSRVLSWGDSGHPVTLEIEVSVSEHGLGTLYFQFVFQFISSSLSIIIIIIIILVYSSLHLLMLPRNSQKHWGDLASSLAQFF